MEETYLFEQALSDVPKYIMDCPVVFQWVEFKGETFFAGLNYDQSLKSKRPMIDLFHCATAGLNNRVLRTVQYTKKNFKPSLLE